MSPCRRLVHAAGGHIASNTHSYHGCESSGPVPLRCPHLYTTPSACTAPNPAVTKPTSAPGRRVPNGLRVCPCMRYWPEKCRSVGSCSTYGFIIATSNRPSAITGALPSELTRAGARRAMGRPCGARTSQWQKSTSPISQPAVAALVLARLIAPSSMSKPTTPLQLQSAGW